MFEIKDTFSKEKRNELKSETESCMEKIVDFIFKMYTNGLFILQQIKLN